MRPTDDADANRIIEEVVDGFDRELGSDITGYYLIGSFADNTAVRLSDVDMVALLNPLASQRLAPAGMLKHSLTHQHGRLDLTVGTPVMFESLGWLRFAPALKRKSRLLKGSDLTETIRDPGPELWSSTLADAWLHDVRGVHRVDEPTSPLLHPSPGEEFLGYVSPAPAWTGVNEWTHDLVVLASLGATVLLAIRAAVQICARSEVAQAYEESIGDEWTDLVQDVDAICRGQWQYEVPQAPGLRAELRTFCERVLEFEEHCLAVVGGARSGTEEPSEPRAGA